MAPVSNSQISKKTGASVNTIMEQTMTNKNYKFNFEQSVKATELEATLLIALLAVESLHGLTAVRMECRFNMDKTNRTCQIDVSTQPGKDLASIFTGFAIKEYGERAVKIEKDIQFQEKEAMQ